LVGFEVSNRLSIEVGAALGYAGWWGTEQQNDTVVSQTLSLYVPVGLHIDILDRRESPVVPYVAVRVGYVYGWGEVEDPIYEYSSNFGSHGIAGDIELGVTVPITEHVGLGVNAGGEILVSFMEFEDTETDVGALSVSFALNGGVYVVVWV